MGELEPIGLGLVFEFAYHRIHRISLLFGSQYSIVVS